MDEQTAKNQKENSTRKSLNKQDSLVLKIVLIAFLILLSFIPMSMIRGLINEREMTANAAAQEVQQKWSKSQTLIGPILTIPYFYQDEKGENQKGYINYLPEQLNITGDVNTQELKRGLYEIIVYNSTLEITGKFSAKDLKESNLFPYDKWIETATINLGISDLRGINEQISLEWDNRKLNFTPGVDPHSLVVSGISSKITPQQLFANDSIVHFTIKLTERLRIHSIYPSWQNNKSRHSFKLSNPKLQWSLFTYRTRGLVRRFHEQMGSPGIQPELFTDSQRESLPSHHERVQRHDR